MKALMYLALLAVAACSAGTGSSDQSVAQSSLNEPTVDRGDLRSTSEYSEWSVIRTYPVYSQELGRDILFVVGDIGGLRDPLDRSSLLQFWGIEGDELVNMTARMNPSGLRAEIPRDVQIADFTGDGLDDLFINNHGTEHTQPLTGEQNQLLVQTLTNGFEDWTDRLPQLTDFGHGSSFGDLDSDGDLDIFVNNLGDDDNNVSYILENNGTGIFTQTADVEDAVFVKFTHPDYDWLPAQGVWSQVIDMDADGDEDIFCGSISGSWRPADGLDPFALWYENRDGKFIGRHTEQLRFLWTVNHVWKFEKFDFDQDGDWDLIQSGHNRWTGELYIQMYENLQGGEWRNVSSTVFPNQGVIPDIGVFTLQIIDFDQDGDKDIAVRGSLGVVNLVNNGAVFSVERRQIFPRGKYLDLNADGLLDEIYYNENDRHFYARING
jgi:hypothetical protein